ncbi:MAG: hypothetical protein EAY66_07785 [Sphingobacteriales bacterium]|nr:MAG: hypothetical protein EAY66_07785 [Sphingobacteriales bacterium]
MKNLSFLTLALLLFFSCKKDTPNNSFVSTKWDLTKTVIIANNNYEQPIKNSDSVFLPHLQPGQLPYIFKVEPFNPKPDTTKFYPAPVQIGFLTFTSLSDISITSAKETCTGNYLDRICTRNLVTTTGKYAIKNDTVSLTIGNETKQGVFLSKDSLVVLTYAKYEYQNNIPKISNTALLGELYIRNK